MKLWRLRLCVYSCRTGIDAAVFFVASLLGEMLKWRAVCPASIG